MLSLYTLSIFLSAFLVFLVQPMVGKIFLPWVGGAPAAWNTCMFFFQLFLLGGYFYTHLSFKKLTLKQQMLLHFILMTVASMALPIAFKGNGAVPDEPTFWLLRQLFYAVALPFLVLSATAPMLQKWFSLSTHQRAADPFFLYAASNTGSLVALLAYPVLIEPNLSIQQQTELWGYGFDLLIFLLVACALFIRHGTAVAPASTGLAEPVNATPPSWQATVLWLLAAAIPSSLFLATTHYLTRDIAPMPMLWILPLTIYLLTYILAFSDWFRVSTSLIKNAALLGLMMFLPVYFLDGFFEIWLSLPVHLYVLFCFALLCHKFLADTRPVAEHLTWFYLWLSVGGVLGGFFNSIVAPMLFTSISEYPLVILLATVFISSRFVSGQPAETTSTWSFALPTITAAIQFAAFIWLIFEISLSTWVIKLAMYFSLNCETGFMHLCHTFVSTHEIIIKFIVCVTVSCLTLWVMQRRLALKLVLFTATVMFLLFVGRIGKKDLVFSQSRNFFGTKEVVVTNKGTLLQLVHGNTLHGAQCFAPGMQREPLAYYHRLGPMSDIFSLPVAQKSNLRVAVLGLGPGNAAAYGKAGDRFTFIEIDPEIVKLAAGTSVFTYLHDSQASCSVLIGDARLKMGQQPDDSFDMIIMAAFSSDSIPAHLLTLEAMQIYLKKLSANGIIVINISNRYLNLLPLVAAITEACHLQCVAVSDHDFDYRAKENFMRMPSLYAVLSRDASQLPHSGTPFRHKWQKNPAKTNYQPWTDSFSSLLSLIRFDLIWKLPPK